MSDPAAVLDQWADLIARQDGPGLAGLYTPTALFFGSTPALRRGQSGVEGYFAALKSPAAPSVTFFDVVVQEAAPGVVNLACVANFVVGGTPYPGRITWTLVEHDGGWKIASHHASPMPG